MYILKICNQIVEEKFHSMGKDYDMIMLYKAIMIYVNAYLNVYMQDFHYYLLVPILQSFKSYWTYTRAKYIVSFYITLLKMRKQIVKDINDRDETIYETDLENII